DIRMPGINGIELIEAIRGKGFDKPIVVLSGYADFTYAKQVMAFGVKHYIVKPARFAEIKKVFGLVKEELDERYAREGKESLPSLPAEKAPGIAEACRAYIKENYRTASLQSIADHVHMNPSYLSTCFHQQTGSKLYDYLAEMRMQEAAKLLVTTDKSIQEISEEVGYKVANSFARIFRQHYDISPSQYRLLHR
ncbi:MAG: helix-turn-helix domain-containing protein, partial [Blautia sp.]|nr:helix-turn-helix domain-containing protein [Blautia sp.]